MLQAMYTWLPNLVTYCVVVDTEQPREGDYRQAPPETVPIRTYASSLFSLCEKSSFLTTSTRHYDLSEDFKMPHKHTRRPIGTSNKDFDLPPTVKARPLSVNKKSEAPEKKTKKRKRQNEDDTPREFKRLMQLQAHMTSKSRPPKPRQNTEDAPKKPSRQKGKTEQIKQEDESAQEVDESEKAVKSEKEEKPQRKRSNGNTDPSWNARGPLEGNLPMLKEKSSRLQRKIEKKVSTWRTEDVRLREKRAADMAQHREKEEARIAELLEKSGVSASVMDDPEVLRQFGLVDEAADEEEKRKVGGKKKRKGKDEDDWEVLKAKREKPKGLHDVVQAPPELKVVKDKFKAQKNNGLPGGGGDAGLKRKAELSEARLETIRRYREMMGRKNEL